MIVRRGDIFFADLSPVVGSEQGGIRPVLIVQNDIGNKYSPTVICAAITSQVNKAKLPRRISRFPPRYTHCRRIPLCCWSKFARLISNACGKSFAVWMMP